MAIQNLVSALVSFVLIAGILPSSPGLNTKLTGPFNIVKLALPLLVGFLIFKRQKLVLIFSKKFLMVGAGLLGLALFGTLTGAYGCEDKSEIYRNFFALTAAVISGLCFFALEAKWRRVIVWGWLGILVTAIILDEFFPKAVEFLNMNVFDPENHGRDSAELMQKILSGIFSRHVLSRFIALIPILFLIYGPYKFSPLVNALALAGSSGIILKTTQRGPYFALCAGLIAYIIHAYRKKIFSKQAALAFAATALMVIISAKVFPTKAILEGRVMTTLQPQTLLKYKQENQSQLSQDARTNAYYRTIAWRQSFSLIGQHPLGYACPTKSEFFVMQAQPKHSHNMYIEQMRVRGWLWGLAFVFIWLLALWRTWKNPSQSLIFMGVVTCAAVGMVDDPLRTIGQNLLFATLLLASFALKSKDG